MTSDGGASSTGGSETTGESTSDSTRTTGSETTGSATTGSATTGSATTGGGGDSLISNGDFSSGEANWSFTGDGTVDTSSGEYCVTSNSGEELQIGWPADVEPASVQSGVSYQFSYTAYYSGGTAPTVGVKVGQAQDPYAAFVEEASISIGSSAMTFTHDFSMDADDAAGILFRVSGAGGTSVCFDDVTLTAM